MTSFAWRCTEIPFDSAGRFDNPYLDVDLVVSFEGPRGQVIRRHAFWDGGQTWRVRFTPLEPGTWRFQVASPTGDSGLDAVRGEVECILGPPTHDIFAHGFLRASLDGHHLEHADGTPFFWLGDTHWRFTHERWDEANKSGWRSQFRDSLDLRVAQGFTVYQTNIMSFGPLSGPGTPWLTGAPFKSLDVEHLRSVVDPRMGYIADRGLVNALGVAWFEAIDDDPVGVARFARYRSYPLVWTLGGEVAGYDASKRSARLAGWRHVALAIRDSDGYRQPITAHLTAERPIASYYQDEDWLDLTLNQHGHGDFDLSATHYLRHLAAHPGRPIVEGESMYEGLRTVEYAGRRTVTASMVRQVAYRSIQSGCCGYTYGAQGCWNSAWDRTDMNTHWGDLPWFEGIDLPGGQQLGHLRRFYESVGWTHLRPDPGAWETTDVFNANLYAPLVSASADRHIVVVAYSETYRRGGGGATLVGLLHRAYQLHWFDPRSGHRIPVPGSTLPMAGSVPVPDPPDPQDWLLVARAEVPE